jgi:hypothetical protein
MLRTLVRVVFGFAVASVAAGLTQAIFVTAPSDISANLEGTGTLALLAATHSAIFAAPFVAAACLIGERGRIRSVVFYMLAGVLIALAGFLAQYSSEVAGQPTIVNNYALKAYLTAGFFGGLVYWLLAGRSAGSAFAPARPTPTA